MGLLIRFLVETLNTVDGQRGSAEPILSQISQRGKKAEQIRSQLFDRVYFKYKVMQVRNKISYSAFARQMTIPEMFFRTVMASYQQLQAEGFLPFDLKREQRLERIITAVRENKFG